MIMYVNAFIAMAVVVIIVVIDVIISDVTVIAAVIIADDAIVNLVVVYVVCELGELSFRKRWVLGRVVMLLAQLFIIVFPIGHLGLPPLLHQLQQL